MIVEEITYGKSYELQGYWEKVSVKIKLSETDTPETVLDHAKKTIDDWHKVTNPDLYSDGKKKELPVIQEINVTDIDKEFEILKSKLSEYEFREDAQSFLDTTDWKYTVMAKALINSKPSKYD